MWLSQVMGIGRGAVADDLTKNLCVSPSCILKAFQRHYRRSFTKCQAIAVRIKWAALRWRERLQRIKAGEDELAQSVVAASQHALGLACSNQVKGVAQRIRA